jgi:NAD(P)-dependent dehydrogenase (short-subunit alcohol dehydrogenase family)
MQSAIVTGANSGLGLECARALLRRPDGWHVVLAVRDPERGRAAVAELGARDRCTVLRLDLASLASVRSFVAESAHASFPPIRALICNAGVQVVSAPRTTEDGIELTFGVNHLGHFALVAGMLPRLEPPARIVVVSSDTHDPKRTTGMPAPKYTSGAELAHPPESVSGRQRYTNSKLCNVLFAYELARRLPEQGAAAITVNALNPGLMPGSGLARDYGRVQQLAWRFLLPVLRVLPSVRGTQTSGRDLAALAADPAYAGVSGRYFDGRKQIRSSDDSYDRASALDLWETSERLVAETDPSPDSETHPSTG